MRSAMPNAADNGSRGVGEVLGQGEYEVVGSLEPIGLDGVGSVRGLMKVRMGSSRNHRHRRNAGFGKRHMISPGKETIEVDGFGEPSLFGCMLGHIFRHVGNLNGELAVAEPHVIHVDHGDGFRRGVRGTLNVLGRSQQVLSLPLNDENSIVRGEDREK